MLVFFQAEDGIRDLTVTGVQTCALPISRLAGFVALTGAVYALNLKTPPELHLGVLYVIPVLLASWHDGMAWGIVFGVATSVLRFLVGIDQLPPTTTLTFRTLNEASYLAVVAVA